MNLFLFLNSWWIPCYGLVGAIVALPWATGIIRRTGPRPAAYFNLLMTILAFVHSVIVWREIWNQEPQSFLVTWFKAAEMDLSFALDVSQVSVGGAVLIAGVSLMAQIYALGYMEKDWALARFFALMGFFEAALSGLAISDSLFLSYALLEMLTLSTYLLVGFWYAQPLAATAARSAFLTKRVGDLLLLMGVVALASMAGSLNFSDLNQWAQTANLPPVTATLLGLALIAGPAAKCAQFPWHLWLDQAMEGPNPASVMRNSMVVAGGAFVLFKLQPIFSLSPVALNTLVVLGAVTALGASLTSIAQIDIKRALAHSTSAYMGLVFIAVGLQQGGVALVLLFTHALAKALLFMSAGSVIATTNTQDLTEMGGLWSRMPATTTAYIVGAAGMVTLLPLGSFWAKLQWVEDFLTAPPWLVGVLLVVNGLTTLNLTRVFRLAFWGTPQPKTRRTPEVGWQMAFPMVSLTVTTLLVPLLMQQWQLILNRGVNLLAVVLLVASSATGFVIGCTISLQRAWSRPISLPSRFIQDLLSYDFYIAQLYRVTIVGAVALMSRCSAWVDRYVVDQLVNWVGLATIFSGESLKYSSSGQSQLHVLTILLGVSLLGLLAILEAEYICSKSELMIEFLQ